mmetsp:Transcript_32472/g.68306  ORF Transcript_32472/g.68306 Transcript_32472/m.68306 type:complete len:203 (+) Transcript_32472:1442-2050(+)
MPSLSLPSPLSPLPQLPPLSLPPSLQFSTTPLSLSRPDSAATGSPCQTPLGSLRLQPAPPHPPTTPKFAAPPPPPFPRRRRVPSPHLLLCSSTLPHPHVVRFLFGWLLARRWSLALRNKAQSFIPSCVRLPPLLLRASWDQTETDAARGHAVFSTAHYHQSTLSGLGQVNACLRENIQLCPWILSYKPTHSVDSDTSRRLSA